MEEIIKALELEHEQKTAEIQRLHEKIAKDEERAAKLYSEEQKLKEKLRKIREKRAKINARITPTRKKIKVLEDELKRTEKALIALKGKPQKKRASRTQRYKVRLIGKRTEVISVGSVTKLKYELRRYYKDDAFLNMETIDDIVKYIREHYNVGANIEAKKTVLILWV